MMQLSVRTLLLAALMAPGVVFSVEIDKVVARVGTETVLRSDVLSEGRRRGYRDGENFVELRNELVERKLILKAAGESKMTMQEWVVENRVREIVNRAFGGDRNRLIETLAKERISYPEWYARLKEDMVVGAMRWNVVDKNVIASPAALRAEFAAHPERYVAERKVTASVIQLKPEEIGRRDEISKALATKSFADLGAERYEAVDPEASFSPEICRALDQLAKGEVSKWIDLNGWSFLVLKEGEESGRAQTFEEAYPAVEAAVKEEAARKLYKAWIERLRAETYVKVY